MLGTQVLGRIWRQMASDLAGGVTPSQFYRRVLDKLIPKATVPDAVPAGANGGSSQQPPLGLEALLRPAWSIVSRQVRAGAKPDPLCFIVLDRLMGLAVVPGVNSRPAGLAGDRRLEGVSGGIGSRTAEQIPFVDDSVLKLDLFGS